MEYSFAEGRLREKIGETGQKIPNQTQQDPNNVPYHYAMVRGNSWRVIQAVII
jgi:uncharacterized protein with HEPN domain